MPFAAARRSTGAREQRVDRAAGDPDERMAPYGADVYERTSLRQRAIHESAHAVIARVLGQPVELVTLRTLTEGKTGPTGNVTTGVCEARDEALSDRIANDHEYDWYDAGLISNCFQAQRRVGDDHVRRSDGYSQRNLYCKSMAGAKLANTFRIPTIWIVEAV